MRIACVILTLMVAAVFVSTGLQAQEKETTLKGTIVCAKCALKVTESCQNAIKVKEADKEVVYFFKDKGNGEEYHDEVCGGEGKMGTVIGKVAEMDGKKWITPTKVEYTKK